MAVACGRIARPYKQMAVACSVIKNRWPWRVAASVALERLAEGFEGFGAWQTARLNAVKNRWPWRVAARVALARPAERQA